jgi:zinc protease
MRLSFRSIAALPLALAASQAAAGSPSIEHWTTANGARVYFVPAPEIAMIDVRVVFSAGSARDGTGKGLANLANGLLKEGAGELDADAFSRQLGATGARMQIRAARDMAYVSLRTLAEDKYAAPALALLIDAVARPRFDEAAIERHKARIIVALKHKQQSAETVAQDAFFRALYAEHPYGSPPDGMEQDVAGFTRSDIVDFHQQYYVAQNAVVAIVGAIDTTHAAEIAEAISSSLSDGQKAGDLPEIGTPGGTEKHIAFPSIQSHVRVGLPGMRRGDPDYFPLLVGNHALGGNSLVSILFREIRSKRGLSYSAYSYFMPMAQPGPFVAALQTDRAQQAEALEVLVQTIEKFVSEGPPPDDLAAAKDNLIGGFPLRIDSNDKIVEYLAMIGFYGLPLDYLETFTAKVEAVSADAVKDAFSRRLDIENLVTVIVGRTGAEADDS